MILETGRVWSGALLAPRDGQMFIRITGRWRVPAVTLPSSAGDTAEGKRVCSSSTWIGLDGTRGYLHSSLPQIGTIQNVVVTNGQMQPEYFAFHEWWHGPISQPIRINHVQVKPGDLIECTLTVDTYTDVTFHMTNHTTGSTSGAISASAPAPLLISGATAEWITERPSNSDTSDPNVGKPYDLANYGTVVFENCIATSARAPGSAPVTNRALDEGGVLLRDMVQIRQNHTRRISIAKLQGPQSVATSYRGPC